MRKGWTNQGTENVVQLMCLTIQDACTLTQIMAKVIPDLANLVSFDISSDEHIAACIASKLELYMCDHSKNRYSN